MPDFFNVRHVSFDLWLTLIKSNPVFKQKRDELLKAYFQIPHSIEVISAKIRMWDLRFNAINEASGKNIDSDELVLLILADLECDLRKITPAILQDYYNNMEELFFRFHPVVYEEKLIEYLQQLSGKGITLSLLSNTGFIKGSTLTKLLQILEIGPLLKFEIYSDEVHVSKPSKEMYQLVFDNIKQFNTIETSSILHIGDNPNADFYGAQQQGMQSALINSNNISLLSLNIHNN
ncbi:MAG: HAD family hydrolase [Bacteroidota bacterium]